MNFDPLFTAVAIIAAVSVLGLLISYWRQSHAFRNYEEYASDAQAVASKLKAQVFRDRDDMVLSGNFGRLPTVVRFSHSDNTPGLNVRMRAPATFTMSVVPKGAKDREGRTLLRTPDDAFDARFATRTDHPTQAKLFIANKAALAQIQKLCCSSQTFLTITAEGVELSELTIPAPYTGQHIQNHLDSMAALAAALKQMPGGEAIKIAPFRKERSNIIRFALVAGAIAALFTIGGAMFDGGTSAESPPAAQTLVPEGLTAIEAQRIGAGPNFRLARASDFDSGGATWVRSQTGHEILPRLQVAFSAGATREAAYVLVNESGFAAGTKRVVVFARNQVSYDAVYPQLALVALVPKSNMAGVPWVGNVLPPDGDGLLLVRSMDDPRSGAVIYLSSGRAATAVPQTYQAVPIQ